MKINIGPKPRYLHAVRAERGDVIRLCSEAVDNAFDAFARTIHITIGDNEISFVDDGIGVAPEKFPALFTLGDHEQLPGTRLGRFGVGITGQAINAADVLDVKSVSVDGCFNMRVNWRDVLRDGWLIDGPLPMPVIVGTPTNSVIKLSALRKLKPHSLDKVIEDLAERFYPAIAEGRTIHVNRIPVPLLADPPMTETVDQRFEFSEGRFATLHGGLLTKPSKVNRVHVGFEHRVIMPGSTIGCGNYTGLSNIFARVQLGGARWALATFKNDITDETQREELEDAVEAAMTSILKKCGNVSIEARVAAIGELVNSMLPEELAASRPHHKKKTPPNPSNKNGTNPGIVDIEKSDAEGPAKARRAPQKDRLLITFEGKDSEHGIGWFEPGRTNRVHLARDNPQIAQLFQNRDDKFVAKAIVVIAVMLFEQGREEANPQLEFKLQTFGRRVAHHLTIDAVAALPSSAG